LIVDDGVLRNAVNCGRDVEAVCGLEVSFYCGGKAWSGSHCHGGQVDAVKISPARTVPNAMFFGSLKLAV